MQLITRLVKEMNKDTVAELRQRFVNYVQTFKSGEPAWQENILLKEEHTYRVCQEILAIGNALGLGQPDLNLAEVMALFHDIGRFEQYARYQTFVDRYSVNHAELGVNILQEQDFLDILDEPTRDKILRVISYHNRVGLPEGETETCLFFAKLLRDADKLDIWRVVTNYYSQNNGRRNSAIELDLPDTPGISELVYADLMAQRIVDIRHLENLNDFKLLQIGWIYDINFVPTLQAVQERQYLEQIRVTLPSSKRLEKIFEAIYDYMGDQKGNVTRQ
jgi:putative nucleotidyltransferase with HDIG domain